MMVATSIVWLYEDFTKIWFCSLSMQSVWCEICEMVNHPCVSFSTRCTYDIISNVFSPSLSVSFSGNNAQETCQLNHCLPNHSLCDSLKDWGRYFMAQSAIMNTWFSFNCQSFLQRSWCTDLMQWLHQLMIFSLEDSMSYWSSSLICSSENDKPLKHWSIDSLVSSKFSQVMQ